MYLIVLLIFLAACKGNTETESKEVSAENTVDEVDISEETASLPTFDFDGLEQAYFNKKNDTTYVLNFWATWCKPCVKELPAFEELNREYSDQKVKVVLVSLDFPENVNTHVIPFMEKKGLQSEVVLLDDPDANTWIPKISKEWSGAIPATLMVRDERQKFYERSFTYTELEKEVKTIL